VGAAPGEAVPSSSRGLGRPKSTRRSDVNQWSTCRETTAYVHGAQIVGAVIALVLLVFALAHLEKVTVDPLSAQLTLPVFLVLAVWPCPALASACSSSATAPDRHDVRASSGVVLRRSMWACDASGTMAL
jgi:uncharacterized integral membrane protein